jgi:hypothetical protein
MITFRSIFEGLVQELTPEKGHMGGVANTISIGEIIDWYGVDTDAFKKFLDDSEIGYDSFNDDAKPIYNSIKTGAPEAYYWLWKHKPDREITRSMKAVAKKDGYVLYAYKQYIYKHVLIDESNGQILGMISASPSSEPVHKSYFGIAPWMVSLSEMVPSARGGGEGKIMYLMFLEARKAIISDSTLYEGSFAMWDTQIRTAAKYSGVLVGDFPIVNKDTSIYDMAIPATAIDNFFASNTIAPWIIKYSNKLNSLNPKECYYVYVESDTYNERTFLEVLDSLAEEADPKLIVDALRGVVRGKRRGKLDPEVNKYIRLSNEIWGFEAWSDSKRLTNPKHIIVSLTSQNGSSSAPIAIYDIDLSLPEPEVKII